MDHIEPNSFRLVGQSKFSAMKSAGSYFKPGDVLYGRLRPYLNKVHLAKFEGVASAEFIVLPRSKFVSGEFIKFLLHQRAFIDHAMSRSSGDRPRVKFEGLADFELSLPPLNEQHRIVEKIETLFARIDKGEEALREVQKLLQRYRQSILKAAVTGELTRDWREANQPTLEPASDLLARILETRRQNWRRHGEYKEPLEVDRDALPQLPVSWAWATMDQLAEVLGGLTKNSKRSELPLKRPMLRVANVYQNRLRLEEVHESGVSEKELDRVSLDPFDILIVEGNGSKDQIGRMAIWRNEIPGAVHQNHLIKARLFEKQLADYVLAWFQSPNGRQVVEIVASSTSGLYTLSLSKIKQLAIPLPSLTEGRKIVTEVHKLFAQADELEAHCAAELTRSAALRQSILKSAFSGQLVKQDPNDEPASKLLTRIRAEREADAARKTASKKKMRKEARARA
jgi:type I restriction enzyme S subunit